MLRFLLAIVGLAAIVLVVGLSLGWIQMSWKAGELPHLAGGKAPEVSANVATVSFGSRNETVTVPTVNINPPADAGANSTRP